MSKKTDLEKLKKKYEKIFSLLDEVKIEKAKKTIDRLLKKTKDDPFLYWLKGYVLLYEGTHNFEEAIGAFNRAIEIDPDNTFAWEFKAIALRSLGRYEEAISCYEKSMELDPLDYNAIYNKAVLLERIGTFEKALDYYSLATKIDPKNTIAWEAKINLLEYLQRFDEAEECRSKVEKDYSGKIVEKDPATPDEWVHKGETLEKLGKYLWANQCYDMALKIDENHQAARDLKYMLLQKHKIDIDTKKNIQKTSQTSEKSII